MRVTRYLAAGGIMAGVLAGPAGAQSSDGVLKGFSDCRAVVAADARLACFDKAAAALESAVKSKEVRIVDRQEVRKARRSLFGFTIPKLALFGGADGDETPEETASFSEINTTVESARAVENGRVEIRLVGEEAVWRTTDPMPFPPRSGAKIRIRKGALGNYFIAIAGERSVRGMRIR
jgi:hypothetical protein